MIRAAELPVVPPRVPDKQRKQLLDAVREAEVGTTAISPEEAVALATEFTSASGSKLSAVPADRTGFSYRRPGSLELGRNLTEITVLHAAAHHMTHPVFPNHGAEFCAVLLALVGRHLGQTEAESLRAAFKAHHVHCEIGRRTRRVKKSAVFATNREPGVLARLVLDEPPEELFCRMLEVRDDMIVVRDGRGDSEISLERCRYLSYKLSL